MRGAQSGGVTAYPTEGMAGVRSRIVNAKRTDLSERIFDASPTRGLFHQLIKTRKAKKNFRPFFVSGHTRFATTSKATLDGTHPHEWTPPTKRRMFRAVASGRRQSELDGNRNSGSTPTAQSMVVHNLITHNGDFEYYQLNGVTYDIDVVMVWLGKTLECEAATQVDSVAVAGMIDLFRTQGCFALSARYVLGLGLSSSFMSENDIDFPTYAILEKIGEQFEEVLCSMLSSTSTTYDDISQKSELRQSFAERVASKLEANAIEFVQPLHKYIVTTKGATSSQDNIERGVSMMYFCLATINAFFGNDLFFATKSFLQNAKGSFGLAITSSLDAHRQICLAARGQTVSIV